jgi:hypothetical protein
MSALLLLLILSFVCFVLAACRIAVPRVDLVAAGLALAALYYLLAAGLMSA